MDAYGETGNRKSRTYAHDDRKTEQRGTPPAPIHRLERDGEGSDLLSYEGLHDAVKADGIGIAGYPDLKIGVITVTNLSDDSAEGPFYHLKWLGMNPTTPIISGA